MSTKPLILKYLCSAAAMILACLPLTACSASLAGGSYAAEAEDAARIFADTVSYREKDYSTHAGPGLQTLPFEHGKFTIYNGTVYYVNPGDNLSTSAGDGTTSIFACKPDGTGRREMASDLAAPTSLAPVIANGRLIYQFRSGDATGYAFINLKDGTRRQCALKHAEELTVTGVWGDDLYYINPLIAMGQGRDEAGNFFCDSSRQLEIMRCNLETTESETLAVFSDRDAIGGAARLQMSGDTLYYWQLTDNSRESESQWVYQFCSFRDKTYVQYPLYAPDSLYTVHDGWVYYAGKAEILRYPLGTKSDWGEAEDIYGNIVYKPEDSGLSETFAALPDSLSVITDMTFGSNGLYVTAAKGPDENGNNTVLCLVSEKAPDPVVLDEWYTP